MGTPRTGYKVTPSDPGADVAGETAAALAASSRVFKHLDPRYSETLLETAEKAFDFARHRAKYSDFLHSAVCPFYCSYSGYLHGFIRLPKILPTSSMPYPLQPKTIVTWDNKLPGTRMLLSQYSLVADGDNKSAARFDEEAKRYICSVLPNLQSTTVQCNTRWPYVQDECHQFTIYVTTSTFLFIVYAKYLKTSKETFSCGSAVITPSLLRRHAKRQINYILGDNPRGMSYMVGYGEKYPQRIHHRASSLPGLQQKSEPFGCADAFQSYHHASEPNPNILIGAVVGGPKHDDEIYDDRDNYAQSEPATYINAPLVGSLANLAASFGS